MSVVHFDQSTWMAKRVQDATDLGPPKPPIRVALPGAKVSIHHDELESLRFAGKSHEEIVEHLNARWRAENAHRLQAQAEWASGPYREAIQKMREAQAQLQAEELKRRAMFEQIMAEHDAR